MTSLTYFSESSNMSSSSPPPTTELAGAADHLPQIPHHSPPSSSYGNLSPSILIIILILGVTIFASVTLCILLRHINRRCLRHLSSSSSSAAATTITASAAVSSRRVSPESLSDSLLDSLPLFVYSAVTRRGGGGGGGGDSAEADCAVCLSKFELDDELRLLPCCHAFHAACVDTWLRSSQTCPLCRSPIFPSEADILKTLGPSSSSARIEIGSVSRREATPSDRNDSRRRSYSIGSSFEYFVDDDDESEVVLGNAAHRRTVSDFKDDSRTEIIAVPETAATEPSLVADVASSGRSWLKDYVDRLSTSLSSRAASFRSSGRFFGGSSRRSDVVLGEEREWDLEASRVGEEISELFRWVSGV